MSQHKRNEVACQATMQRNIFVSIYTQHSYVMPSMYGMSLCRICPFDCDTSIKFFMSSLFADFSSSATFPVSEATTTTVALVKIIDIKNQQQRHQSQTLQSRAIKTPSAYNNFTFVVYNVMRLLGWYLNIKTRKFCAGVKSETTERNDKILFGLSVIELKILNRWQHTLNYFQLRATLNLHNFINKLKYFLLLLIFWQLANQTKKVLRCKLFLNLFSLILALPYCQISIVLLTPYNK